MLFVLLPSLQFTDDISSKHTHLFQIRGKNRSFLSQISGNSVKVCCKSGATRHIIKKGGASNKMRHLYFLIRFTTQNKGSHRMILDNQFTSKKILPYLMVFALP
jgi:hypothetical protein